MMRLSIVMPIWREAGLSSRLLPLLAGMAPEDELILVDAGSGSLQGLPADRRIRTLAAAPKGRGYQLIAGAELAQGEVLLFLHADTRLPPEGLQRLRQLLHNRPGLAGGAFDLAIDSPRAIFRLIETVASWRSRLTRLPYGDQALFLRREAYWQIGGFPAVPLMEDVGIGQRLRRAGLKLGFVSRRVQTSARRWESEGVWRCTLRNWTLLLAYYRGVAPEKLAEFYR